MKTLRVVDLRSAIADSIERFVEANSAEAAASSLVGVDVVRGASKYAKPVARDTQEKTNMVRLYARLGPTVSHNS